MTNCSASLLDPSNLYLYEQAGILTSVKSVVDVVAGVDGIILPQAVAEIPWGHNILLLEKVKDLKARFWYVHKNLEYVDE